MKKLLSNHEKGDRQDNIANIFRHIKFEIQLLSFHYN
jgi:hypothetical protein